MTYLELCQGFVQELGVAGGGENNPSAVTGQTGELLNVVNWIAAAELEINNQCLDWKYLWAEYSQALAIDDQEPTLPTGVLAPRTWIKDSFYLDRFGVNQRKLVWLDWSDYRDIDSFPNQPQSITMKPNGVLRLDAKMTQALTLTGEYYKAPTRMSANADVSPIPAEYHRIILCRAAVIYGGREDAPEVVNHYEPEYIEILNNLEMTQRPQREQEGDPEAYDHLEQTIPGFEDLGTPQRGV